MLPIALLCAAAFAAAASGCFRGGAAGRPPLSAAVSDADWGGADCVPPEAAAAPEAAPAGPPPPPAAPARESVLFEEAVLRGLPRGALLLVADTSSGVATLVSRGRAIWRMPFSGASAGLGSKAGSNMTPPGWHRVAERFGAGAAPGTLFVSRRATGRVLGPAEWNAPDPAEDAVLTRVMWLEGLEPGVNKGPGIDSHERFIYLHGTNQEQKLGTPASHGCLRFSNADVAKLFDLSEGVELYCFIE